MPHCKSLALSLSLSLFDTRWMTVCPILSPPINIYILPFIRVIFEIFQSLGIENPPRMDNKVIVTLEIFQTEERGKNKKE